MDQGYIVLKPSEICLGNTYGQWITKFILWLFSTDLDKNNNGNVVFLRPFVSSPDPNYTSRIQPNIMVGTDGLEVSTDQYIFVPMLFSYWADPTETEMTMRQRIWADMTGGDNPPTPDQITINGENIELQENDTMAAHLMESPLFTLQIPESGYDKTMKDYMDTPLISGTYQAIGGAFAFLIKFNKEGLYRIHSYGRGNTTEKGEYHEEFLYEVHVIDSSNTSQPQVRGLIPSAATRYIDAKIDQLQANSKLTQWHVEELKGIIKNSREKNEISILSYRIKKAMINKKLTNENLQQMTQFFNDESNKSPKKMKDFLDLLNKES